MKTILIDGRKIKENILEEIKKEISILGFQPVFCDVLVGDDLASVQYVNMKARVAESLGIKFLNASFPKDITTEDLTKEIKLLNKIENISGIIIQLPLPDSIDKKQILNAIDERLDVDCLGSIKSEKFYNGEQSFGLPTALACIEILNSLNIDLSTKNIVVLGQGELVGKPVSKMLSIIGLKVLSIDTKTENPKEIIKNGDIVISAIGNGKYITGDMIKDGAILIDAGTSESNSAIVGDVDLDSVLGIASIVSPVPGGVGPVTVAMLFRNVLEVAKNINN